MRVCVCVCACVCAFLLDHLKEFVVRHLDVAGHVPGQVDHGDDGLDTLQLVPLVALHCLLVLVGWGANQSGAQNTTFVVIHGTLGD